MFFSSSSKSFLLAQKTSVMISNSFLVSYDLRNNATSLLSHESCTDMHFKKYLQKCEENVKYTQKHVKYDSERLLHLRKISNLCLILKDDDSRMRLIHAAKQDLT